MIFVPMFNFTKYPGGRHTEDGPGSAEEFLNTVLFPILNHNKDVVIVYMDDVYGYSSCFLHELVTNINPEYIKRIQFISKRESLINELKTYNRDIITN